MSSRVATSGSLMALGRRIDGDLAAGDVRLTMGAEPTFVDARDREAAEWRVAALGPTKKAKAAALLVRLADRFARAPILQDAQGKQYPGEAAPRWALQCVWRADGRPAWRDPRLLVPPAQRPGRRKARLTDAQRVAEAIARALRLDPALVRPAFEDPWHAVWAARRRPVGEGREDEDAATQAELDAALAARLGAAAGYVLPLAWRGGAWDSQRWRLRTDRLYLLPGELAMGVRLPLDTLPQGDETIRTALCVEARDGIVRVFLPPLPDGTAFLRLVAAVERAAARTGRPVALDGYPPDHTDPTLRLFTVTPDPGVVELNVQPEATWRSVAERTRAVYEAARAVGLAADTYLHNGRRIGTGGGCHIVLGGPTSADSPFVRRPALLESMLRYWQAHPALSYAFAGLFVGPTCQHARFDEAHADGVEAMELALAHRRGADLPLEELLRRHLTDAAGNPHRAEFCIDKLYPPYPGGPRRGLLELRAFEMPPDAASALAVQLLVRALVARLWRAPYADPPVRWGAALHDRFMLPHFLWRDLGAVLDDLAAHGYRLAPRWFAPRFAFRFPAIGTLEHGGAALSIRHAIEPWPVLGEPTAGSTSRPVDSSVERIELTLTGRSTGRYAVSCNGFAIPMQPMETGRGRIAGLRFAAWRLPLGRHPALPAQTPLVLALHDRKTGRAVAAATYHAGHPRGRLYRGYPKTAAEAARRAAARFVVRSPRGLRRLRVEGDDPPGPVTVDLRWLEHVDAGRRGA